MNCIITLLLDLILTAFAAPGDMLDHALGPPDAAWR